MCEKRADDVCAVMGLEMLPGCVALILKPGWGGIFDQAKEIPGCAPFFCSGIEQRMALIRLVHGQQGDACSHRFDAGTRSWVGKGIEVKVDLIALECFPE